MSAQKKLRNATKNIRVVAMPSRKKEIPIKDSNGEQMKDKNGEPIIESVQLYKIKPMR
jgi:hypothetical protein